VEEMFEYKVYETIRNSKGLKDKQVADAAGVTPSTFSDWKSGRSAPKLDKIIRIAKVLGVSPADIAQQPVTTIEYDENMKIKRVHLEEPQTHTEKRYTMSLTMAEMNIINNYRRLNDVGKGFFDTQFGMILKEDKFLNSDIPNNEDIMQGVRA
jgi:transcriptional regulator with XRE-family HTH domain